MVRLVYTHYKLQITVSVVYTSTRCLAHNVTHLYCFARLYSAQYWSLQCRPTPLFEVHRPWALFRETMVKMKYNTIDFKFTLDFFAEAPSPVDSWQLEGVCTIAGELVERANISMADWDLSDELSKSAKSRSVIFSTLSIVELLVCSLFWVIKKTTCK